MPVGICPGPIRDRMTVEVAPIVETATVGCSLWHSPLVSGAGTIGARVIEGEISRQKPR